MIKSLDTRTVEYFNLTFIRTALYGPCVEFENTYHSLNFLLEKMFHISSLFICTFSEHTKKQVIQYLKERLQLGKELEILPITTVQGSGKISNRNNFYVEWNLDYLN